MKKFLLVLLSVVFLGAGFPGLSMGATLADIAGDYNVVINTKFKVKKLGSDINTSFGLLTLEGSTFYLVDYGAVNDVSGIIGLDSKGKKITFSLDSNGFAALEDTMTNWLVAAAGAEGIYISNVDFTFTQIKTSKVKIDKNTNRAKGKAQIKIKGTVSGLVDGEYQQTKFSYQSKIIIQ